MDGSLYPIPHVTLLKSLKTHKKEIDCVVNYFNFVKYAIIRKAKVDIIDNFLFFFVDQNNFSYRGIMDKV